MDRLPPPSPLPLYEECFRCASIVQGRVRLSAAAEQAARQRKYRHVPARRFGSLVPLSAGHAYASLADA